MANNLGNAMLAVYFHAEREYRPLPPDFDSDAFPMPLQRAIEIVADTTKVGSNERLRCAAKLLTFSSIEDGRIVISERVQYLLLKLDVPLDRLDKFLSSAFKGTWPPEPPQPPDLPPIECPPIEPPPIKFLPFMLELLMYKFWGTLDVLECVPEPISNVVGYDPYTGVSTVHYEARITRPFSEAIVALDPQNWDQCSPYFPNVYLAKANAMGEYETNANHDGIENTDPGRPQPGTPWNDVVFEHFEMTSGWSTSWFRNFLDIQTTVTASEFRYDYSLRESIRSYTSWFWPPEIDAGLNLDDGFFLMQIDPADGNALLIEGFKRIRMSGRGLWNSTLNFWTAVFLRALGDESSKTACECNP